ncbi:hypothetical protein HIM_00875 [Hirsutella minnesotensis 3608]|nr:hypothetical protein HIM_00875 [Hirsutella minnesotensis 3608]
MAAVVAQTPPAIHAPSDKERKYDRQLRLWAASGQSALESAHVLLVNAGSGTVGIETLKNLVLPGIGAFTIADPAVVNESDLGVNFFLDQSCRGKSRAQCCTQLLNELNPDVQGDWFPKAQTSYNLQELFNSSVPFTLIMYASPLDTNQIGLIRAYAANRHIPVVAIHSAGFYSYFKVDLPGPFPIVDTHPEDDASADLRLLNPWPELSSFAADMTREIDSLDDHEHGHVPLVVILLRYLSIWRQARGNSYPSCYSDKVAFRQLIGNAMRKDNAEGGEENFEEAMAGVMKLVTSHPVPASLKQVFDFSDQLKGQNQSSFWIIGLAVKQFYLKHQELPLPGNIPDMKAKSDVYIKLQSIYKDKARRDALEVFDIVRSLDGGEQIELSEVELFCKNARFIKLVNAEISKPNLDEIVAKELANDEVAAVTSPEVPESLLPIYLALTATSHVSKATTEEILSSIMERAPALAKSERMHLVAQEVSRAAGGEIHNISAITGGMVAQEVIKIVTKQYVPIDSTCILDGIQSRCQVLRL